MRTRMDGSAEIGAGSERSAFVIRRFGSLHAQLRAIARCRQTNLGHGELLRVSRKRKLRRRAVQLLESCPRVAEPHTTTFGVRRRAFAGPVVAHAHPERVALQDRLDLDAP